MSIETKTYIPGWLWGELQIFLVYPESKHKETLFVLEKEGYESSMFEINRIISDDVLTRFNIGDTINLVTILVVGKGGVRNSILCGYLCRYNMEIVKAYDYAHGIVSNCNYKISDIIRIRDSMTCRRIIFDDTKPLWDGLERVGRNIFRICDGMRGFPSI